MNSYVVLNNNLINNNNKINDSKLDFLAKFKQNDATTGPKNQIWYKLDACNSHVNLTFSYFSYFFKPSSNMRLDSDLE